jgi:hypothetical protein
MGADQAWEPEYMKVVISGSPAVKCLSSWVVSMGRRYRPLLENFRVSGNTTDLPAVFRLFIANFYCASMVFNRNSY